MRAVLATQEAIETPWKPTSVHVLSLHAGSTMMARSIIKRDGRFYKLELAFPVSSASAGRVTDVYFNTVDLVNRLEEESRLGKAGALAAQLSRLDLVVLDELGYLPFAHSGGQLLFHLVSKLFERTSVTSPPTWRSASGRPCSAARS